MARRPKPEQTEESVTSPAPVPESVPPVTPPSDNSPDVEALNRLQTESQIPSEPPKRRGRPKGSRNAPKPGIGEDVFPPALVRDVLKAPYSLLSNFRGEHWRLTDEEADNMVQTHLALLNKYLPDWIGDNTLLYAVIFQHTLLIVARMHLDARMREEANNADTSGSAPVSGKAGFGKVYPISKGLEDIPPGFRI